MVFRIRNQQIMPENMLLITYRKYAKASLETFYLQYETSKDVDSWQLQSCAEVAIIVSPCQTCKI